MAISAPSTQSRVYPQHPKGRAQLVLIGIVDRGVQKNIFDETKPDVPKLSFHFESAHTDENDTRYNISKWVTNSKWFDSKTGKTSGMVQMLSQWLDCAPAEIPPALFDDLELLCGLNATARIALKPKQDGEMKANIEYLEPWENDETIIEPEEAVGDGEMFRGKTVSEMMRELGVAWPPNAAPAKPRIGAVAGSEADGVRAPRQTPPTRANTVPDEIAGQSTFEETRRQRVKDLAAGKDVEPIRRPARPPVPAPAMEPNDDDDDSVFDDEDDDAATLPEMPKATKKNAYGVD